MKVYVNELNDFRELEVVGEYGIFHNPVVLYNDREIVAELYDLTTGNAVCQSAGCTGCISKGNSGCRLYASDNIEYLI